MDDKKVEIKRWIRESIQNERSSQRKLYGYFFADMCRMVEKYTRDKDAVISIVNNGFLRIFQNLNSYDQDRPFKPWAKTLVFRALSDYFRSNSSAATIVPIFDRDAIHYQPALDNLFLEDLLEHLNQLPNTTRKVFILYAVKGYKHREIAEMLSISSGTSKWHVSQARRILKDHISNLKDGEAYGL